jgi:hypothetical protein
MIDREEAIRLASSPGVEDNPRDVDASGRVDTDRLSKLPIRATEAAKPRPIPVGVVPREEDVELLRS